MVDITVITTYRCDSKCSMCYVWQNPTVPAEEVTLQDLAKLPSGIDYLNLSGGEPTLRQDLAQIVDLLHPKTAKLEISSNGMHADRLEPIVKRYPDIKIRFSLDGTGATNDTTRGEKDGFRQKTEGLLRLKRAGGQDLGFGATIQDANAAQLEDLFTLARTNGVEFATSALHNGFQFFKADNWPYDRVAVARQIERLIAVQLTGWDVKTWFRAYVNLGLIAKVLGAPRLLPCTAGTSFAFIDPWGDVYACNVRPDLKLGNLKTQSWGDIINGQRATAIRKTVSRCEQNCWMVGSAKTAMRNRHFAQLPRLRPLSWVALNRLRVAFGLRIPFERYVDYGTAMPNKIVERPSFISVNAPKHARREADDHYQSAGQFFNR